MSLIYSLNPKTCFDELQNDQTNSRGLWSRRWSELYHRAGVPLLTTQLTVDLQEIKALIPYSGCASSPLLYHLSSFPPTACPRSFSLVFNVWYLLFACVTLCNYTFVHSVKSPNAIFDTHVCLCLTDNFFFSIVFLCNCNSQF